MAKYDFSFNQSVFCLARFLLINWHDDFDGINSTPD